MNKKKNYTNDYIFLGFLILLNVMNFVDRTLLISFSNFIVPELELKNWQFALLTGIGFLFFYSIMGIFMGILADKFHRPRLIAVGVLLWSLLTSVSGAARSFVGLLIPRMFIGVGESILTPTSISILSDRFPSNKMGFITGAYYMGIPIGVGVSLLIAGYLGPSIGWRTCFYVLGAVGVVLAAIMYFVKETPRVLEEQDKDQDKKINLKEISKDIFHALKSSPALTLCIYGGVAIHLVLGAAAFDQLWLVRERGFDRAEIAQITGYIGVSAGVLGNLFGGIGSDWFTEKFKLGRPMFLFWIILIIFPLGIAGRLVAPDSIVFWIAIILGFFQLGTLYGPIFSTVQELAPVKIRATVVAFFILNLNLVGMFVGTTGAGILLDILIGMGIEEPYTKTLLFFTVLSGILALPLFWFAGIVYKKERKGL